AMLLRIQNVRVEAWSLRGRLALAAKRTDEAARAVRELRKERVGWAWAQAVALEALLEPARRAELLGRAIAGFDQHGLKLFAASARLRLGQISDDEVGRANVRAALAWFETQDVVEPESFARMLVPAV
nr:hypothetical protein [Myxococcaceae bacterium]